VADADGQFLLDFNPELKPIERDQARAFVDEHHEHNKAPLGWKFGAGIWNGSQLIGVVMAAGRWPDDRTRSTRRSEPALRAPRRAWRAALERVLDGVRLVRARGREARLREDHHVHARERARHRR
jgi:hypothetical protein